MLHGGVDSKKDLTLHDIYELIKQTSGEQTAIISKELDEKFSLINKNLDTIRKDTEHLQKKYLSLERSRRKNNIVIFGLSIETTRTTELVAAVISHLNRLTEVEIKEADINNVYYIGKKQSDRGGVIVEFITFLKKLSILRNAYKLKGSGVAISNDLCQEDRARNKILVKHLKIAKEQKLLARIRGDRLEVDSKFYTVEDLERSGDEECEGDEESESGDESNCSVSTGQARSEKNESVEAAQKKLSTLKQHKKKRKRNEKNSPPFLRNRNSKKRQ